MELRKNRGFESPSRGSVFNSSMESKIISHLHLNNGNSQISQSDWYWRGEWPSGLYSLRQVTEVKLGRVRSDFGWVTSED